jgi:hypothetical protein
MNVFAEKYFIFITSGGRTGTKFFGDLLGDIIQGSFSIHEPDVFSGFKYKSIHQLRQFGFRHLILGKLTGKTGIRNLSQNYLSKKISLKELEEAISRHRENYYYNIENDLIIESYSGWYGAIPGIRRLYKKYKIVIVLRDPRDWVISNMDWGTMYGERDWISKLGLSRLNPKMIQDKEYDEEWTRFSRFQKLCWAWKTIYEIMLKSSENNPNIKVVKFEDIFRAEAKYKNMKNLLTFITHFSDRNFSFKIPENLLERRVNKNISYKFREWKNWDDEMKNDLLRICGNVMHRLNY